jgi:hypothetical protein
MSSRDLWKLIQDAEMDLIERPWERERPPADPRIACHLLDYEPCVVLHASRDLTRDDAARILARIALRSNRPMLGMARASVTQGRIVLRLYMRAGWTATGFSVIGELRGDALIHLATNVLRAADEVLGTAVVTECTLRWLGVAATDAVAEWTKDGRLSRLEPNPDDLPLAQGAII